MFARKIEIWSPLPIRQHKPYLSNPFAAQMFFQVSEGQIEDPLMHTVLYGEERLSILPPPELTINITTTILKNEKRFDRLPPPKLTKDKGQRTKDKGNQENLKTCQ